MVDSDTPAQLAGYIAVPAMVIADIGSERETTVSLLLVAYIVVAGAVELHHL